MSRFVSMALYWLTVAVLLILLAVLLAAYVHAQPAPELVIALLGGMT